MGRTGMNRRMVSLILDDDLYSEAKEYKINISDAARKGIAAEIERQKKIKELLGE